MWFFSPLGFYSVVCAKKSPESHELDTNKLMIRARCREHLENLLKRFPNKLAGLEILEIPYTDYHCRIIVDRGVWAEIMAELTNDIDYSNFKNEVKDSGYGSNEYLNALHRVWDVMYDFQGRANG